MSKPRLLISEGKDFSLQALDLLRNTFDIVVNDKASSSEIRNKIKDFDFLWIRLNNYIGKDILDASINLKAIITATTGLNCIDSDECIKKNIKIISLKDEQCFLDEIKSTAELTIALIFILLRNIIPAQDSVKKGSWDRQKFKGNELYKKKVGIIGYGRLGKMVTSYLACFGAEIFIYDPYVTDMHSNCQRVSLIDIFSHCDIATIHAKHTPETTKMINKDLFECIQKPFYLVNTARGEIVDETDLLEALENEKISGVAIDVLADETQQEIKRNVLAKYAKKNPNLIITPHLGGCCYESFEKTEVFMAQRLLEYYYSNS